MKLFRTLAIAAIIATCLPWTAHAQSSAPDQPAGNALEQGLWWLYHLQYDKARELFSQYAELNPKDPAGYFYKTAADWWQLAQEFDQQLPEVVKHLDED